MRHPTAWPAGWWTPTSPSKRSEGYDDGSLRPSVAFAHVRLVAGASLAARESLPRPDTNPRMAEERFEAVGLLFGPALVRAEPADVKGSRHV
jgi:hypothetical protein